MHQMSDLEAKLVRSADLEIIPLRGVAERLAVVPKQTTITITSSPKLGSDRTLEYTALAARAGYRVVPHLAAREVTDRANLREIVARLRGLGVKDLYVIGGDEPEPAGSYSSAGDLLEDLAFVDDGFETIGVACYPEGHPLISDASLLEALRRKQPLANYMVSQLCFDPDAVIRWLRLVRSEGVLLPLRVGVAAPLEMRRLASLSLKVGVGSSIRYLTHQHGFIAKLLPGRSYHPERFLHAIRDALSSAELRIEGLHLFSFNQISSTVEWQREIGGLGRAA
jgi:methylenetetrahydrofolate reductase (NADPH)